jgi:hypothetical protein
MCFLISAVLIPQKIIILSKTGLVSSFHCYSYLWNGNVFDADLNCSGSDGSVINWPPESGSVVLNNESEDPNP